MQVLSRKIVIRKPFKLIKPAAISRLYMALTGTYGKGGAAKVLTGLYTLMFFAWQKLVPWPSLGIVEYQTGRTRRRLVYNGKNTQFESVYHPDFYGGYEPEVGAVLDTILDTGSTFYDIGSNWGYFSLYAASSPAQIGRIYAFEPFPETYADLESMVDQAGLGSQIICHKLALGKETTTARISYRGLVQSGLAALSMGDRRSLKDYIYPASTVKITTLDEVAGDPPSVLKIDVEGAEADVLAGGKMTISKHRPMIIFENWSDPSTRAKTVEPLETLQKWGYQLFYPQVSMSPTRLVLTPFEAKDRHMYGRQINVLACHASRIKFLREKFLR